MKIARYEHSGSVEVGIVVADEIVPVAALDRSLPDRVDALLAADTRAFLREAAPRASRRLPLAQVRLLAPIPRPSKFLAIGLNYRSHLEEFLAKGNAAPDPDMQIWFNKQTSCICGPYDDIHLPTVSEQLDYEGELGVVIGTPCRDVPRDQAMRVVGGYMIVNDVSVRDWQKRTPTATLGKSFDTHGPTGPWLTTADEIPAPHALGLRTLVDGVVAQEARTDEMLTRIDAMIAHLSTVMTLEAGDILATGTPAGVGMGRTPPSWLREGQVVRVEIEGLGAIENRVVAQPDTRLPRF